MDGGERVLAWLVITLVILLICWGVFDWWAY